MEEVGFDQGFRCWTICFACFIINMLLDGVINSFGVILEVLPKPLLIVLKFILFKPVLSHQLLGCHGSL